MESQPQHPEFRINPENLCSEYCKLGNFSESFIFVKSVKSCIWVVKNSQLGHDLPISVDDRAILPFGQGFIFMNLCIFIWEVS